MRHIFQDVTAEFSGCHSRALSGPSTRHAPGKAGPRSLALALLLVPPLLVLAACEALSPSQPSSTSSHASAAAPSKPADLSPYLETLEQMAPGDASRQSATLASALAASQQAPTAANRLRYALALGAAGHAASNPVEAKRLISELLASQHELKPQEVALAQVFLREFDARVELYADMARQREELERQLQSASADDDRRNAALTSENARLKKALAEAERKLEAVAEMERSLLEKSEAAPANDKPPRP